MIGPLTISLGLGLAILTGCQMHRDSDTHCRESPPMAPAPITKLLQRQYWQTVLEWDQAKTTLTTAVLVLTGAWCDSISSHIAPRQSPHGYKAQSVKCKRIIARWLFFSLSYFRFCTSVFILQRFPLVPTWHSKSSYSGKAICITVNKHHMVVHVLADI